MGLNAGELSHNEKTVVIKGVISNYRIQCKSINFFAEQANQQGLVMASAGAALSGLSGLAVGMAMMASDDLAEEVDYVQFDLEGYQVEGFLWASPFMDGDVVEVVAERWPNGQYQAFGICRPADKIIALRPHCTRGKVAHYWMSCRFYLRWFLFVFIIALGFRV